MRKGSNLFDIMEGLGYGEFADELLRVGLVSSFDRFVVSAAPSGGVSIYFVGVQGGTPCPEPLPAGACRLQPHKPCVSLRCAEDGDCRLAGCRLDNTLHK